MGDEGELWPNGKSVNLVYETTPCWIRDKSSM